MLNVILQCVIMLNIITLNVITLKVIVLSVVAPLKQCSRERMIMSKNKIF
jgi:hypothetical protein